MQPALTQPRPRSRPLAVSAVGILGALLVHGVMVFSFVLDLSMPSRKPPDRSGAGASALRTASADEMTVVFINEPSPPSDAPLPKLEPVSSHGLASPELPLVVLSPDPSPASAADRSNKENSDSAAPAADAAQHALMYGRYVGQVQARIERAWMRPRTEIGAERFSCRIRITQDRRGGVVDVRLDHCNGTERWQQSLVSAIRTASPLPAPPDESVYADVIWLSFTSEGFEPGGSTQGFEPGVLTASVDRRDRVKDDSGVIHLTIIGAPRGASPSDHIPAAPPATPAADLQPPEQPPQ
jgi:hypothetical protein